MPGSPDNENQNPWIHNIFSRGVNTAKDIHAQVQADIASGKPLEPDILFSSIISTLNDIGNIPMDRRTAEKIMGSVAASAVIVPFAPREFLQQTSFSFDQENLGVIPEIADIGNLYDVTSLEHKALVAHPAYEKFQALEKRYALLTNYLNNTFTHAPGIGFTSAIQVARNPQTREIYVSGQVVSPYSPKERTFFFLGKNPGNAAPPIYAVTLGEQALQKYKMNIAFNPDRKQVAPAVMDNSGNINPIRIVNENTITIDQQQPSPEPTATIPSPVIESNTYKQVYTGDVKLYQFALTPEGKLEPMKPKEVIKDTFKLENGDKFVEGRDRVTVERIAEDQWKVQIGEKFFVGYGTPGQLGIADLHPDNPRNMMIKIKGWLVAAEERTFDNNPALGKQVTMTFVVPIIDSKNPNKLGPIEHKQVRIMLPDTYRLYDPDADTRVSFADFLKKNLTANYTCRPIVVPFLPEAIINSRAIDIERKYGKIMADQYRALYKLHKDTAKSLLANRNKPNDTPIDVGDLWGFNY